MNKLVSAMLFAFACLTRMAHADSFTLSETWKDNTAAGVYSSTTDSGTFSASLTVPGLSSFTADQWSNLVVSINSPLSTASDGVGTLDNFSDNMADAPNYGGAVTSTSATFHFQLSDTNENSANAFKITFSRSGNVLTIAGQTENPASVQPPWSILTWNFEDYSSDPTFAFTNQPISFEVELDDAESSSQYADLTGTLYVTGTNTITTDSLDETLNSIRLTGVANLTAPTLTTVSPLASATVSNALLTVQMKATDNFGVENVEFYFNGMDFGSGALLGSNLWSAMFPLNPGPNVIQALATDFSGNNSPTNTLTMTYVNRQTNANLITFSEHYQDASYVDNLGDTNAYGYDVGVFNAALTVPGLQAMSANTWSNLSLNVQIGAINFGNTLDAADVLTATSAVFYTLDGYQLNISRSGNTLVLMASGYEEPGLYTNYLGEAGIVSDATTCVVTLSDNSTNYLNVSKPVFISGTNVITHDGAGDELDNLQITGAASYAHPVLTSVSPAASATVTNALLNVQVKATSLAGVSNVEFYVNGRDYGTGMFDGTNKWSMNFALNPGTNLIQTVAADYDNNLTPTNTLTMVYVNRQTNANLITFSEHWQDGAQWDIYGDLSVVSQDVGTLNAALTVPSLPAMSASTWSNLIFTLSFGNVTYSNSLSAAGLLTATNAVFYLPLSGPPQLTPIAGANLYLSRAGNRLTLVYETGNPLYYLPNSIIAGYYYESVGPILDNENFALNLVDGNTQTPYAAFSQPVFYSGSNWVTDVVSYLPCCGYDTNELDNLQIAGAADFTAPTNQIVTPASGATVSNGLFTASGKAGDNRALASVLCSLNSGPWTNAVLANNGTNWSAALALTAGGNNLKAFAVDTSGNYSATSSVSFVYVVSGQLQLQKLGLGTFSPNYSNAWLQIGKSYSITSTPASGFKFTGWTISTNGLGGTINTSAVETFTMSSNLTLLATFVDTNRPTLTISSPTSGQRMSNALATVKGGAGDNWKVSGVWYQFNGAAWTPAPTTNSWTNWGMTLPLVAGTNTLKAFALDVAGNYSSTNSVSFVSSNTFKLQLAFGAGRPLMSNGLSFTLQLSSNLTGHLEYSTNLINWLTWTNFKGTNTAITFRDAAATNSPRRFYRAVIP